MYLRPFQWHSGTHEKALLKIYISNHNIFIAYENKSDMLNRARIYCDCFIRNLDRNLCVQRKTQIQDCFVYFQPEKLQQQHFTHERVSKKYLPILFNKGVSNSISLFHYHLTLRFA